MKNKILISVAILMIALSTIACSFGGINVSINTESVKGSGNLETETRAVANIKSVALTSVGDLTIIMADQEKLEIEAEDNLLPFITSEVRNGQLILGVEENKNIQPTQSIRYTLYVNQPLEGLAVSGLGSIRAPQINTDRLDVDVSGAGDVKLDGLYAERLDVSISGLGSIYIDAGEVTQQTTQISGSGNLDAEDMLSQEAEIRISGLGNANVWVEDQLTVEISGSGNVSYFGSPSVRQEISGIGSLNHEGEH